MADPTSTPSPAVVPVRTPGPRVRTALVVGILGIALALTGFVALVRVVVDVFDAPTHRIPGTVRVHLRAGDYVIYEHSPFADGYDLGARADVVTIRPRTVHITGPSGSPVSVDSSPSDSTLTMGTRRFVSALGFHASHDGAYTLRFDATQSSEVMIQRPLGGIVRHSAGWIVAVIAGGLLTVAGLVLLIVGIIRRSNARQAASLPAPMSYPMVPPPPVTTPPPAWHPDPSGTHRLRYWDGTAWTEHTSD